MKKSINLTTGASSNAVADAIKTGYTLTAIPRLTVDWNLNRYYNPVASNTPSEDTEGFDIESYPIESIVEPQRPSKGIAKARVGQSVVSRGYVKTNDPRFYVSDVNDKYKYWTSPYVTNGSGVFPNHSDGVTSARPEINYDRLLKANKIVIKLENTWATPKDFSVRVKRTIGGNFFAVGGNNPAINGATGTLTLYYNGSAWTTTKPATLVSTDVAGIQLRVDSMGPGITRNGTVMTYQKRNSGDQQFSTNGSNSSLNVIAIEAHLEVDLTDRLVNVSDTFDMSESSQLYPIGTITSNQADISLANEDGAFNPENTTSPYYGLIDANAEFNLEYIYTINNVKHSVQGFKMYSSGPWGSSQGLTDITVEDSSKFLKEIKPNQFMIEGKTSTEIIWRLLDSVGFVDYEIDSEDLADENIIPFYWTDGEKTVWEELDEIASATQTAIYFDSYNKLQVKTRQAAFRDSAPVDWNLMGIKRGTRLDDIIDWQPTQDFEANKFDVTYKATNWKTNSKGQPAMSQVWEPESEVVTLRSAPLKRTMPAGATHLFLSQQEIEIWPYSGKVQVDGEIISYEGKEFVYYTYTEEVNQSTGIKTYSNPVRNVINAESEQDMKKANRKTPGKHRGGNHFTGGLKVVERGVWNTEEREHSVDVDKWSTKLELNKKGSGSITNNPNGFNHRKIDSIVTINTPGTMNNENDTFWAFRGGVNQNSYRSYGTKFRFNKDSSSNTQTAGLCYQLSGARENGYYVEVKLSKNLEAKDRTIASEVRIYSKVNNVEVQIGKGADTAIGEDIWYEMDVYHTGSGNNQTISVWINGQKVASATTTGSTVQPDSARFGFFARGKTNISFEYIYAVARANIKEPLDDYGFFDLKYGGIRGGRWEREWVWSLKTRYKKIKKKKSTQETYRHNKYVFDEFGPYVHEIREFDVEFSPAPVRYSYLFNTNDWYSAVLEYNGTPFGARFIMSNVSRNNAVLNGEDRLSYAGTSSGINQVLTVLGQNLEIADEETVTRKNDASIRARGVIESELSSDWIQNKAMAKDIAMWLAKNWSESIDEIEVEVVGNPLLEIGDIVDVDFPEQHASPATHQYFVVGTSNSFETGVATRLTIRRRRVASDIS